MGRLTTNEVASAVRSALFATLFDHRGDRDYNKEFGYPDEPSIKDYQLMWDRNDIARRVVSIEPRESWRRRPWIYETENPSLETPFEKALDELEKSHKLLSYLKRIDILSGVGRFGLLLLGIDDGLPLDLPVKGFESGVPESPVGNHKLLYMRCFVESQVTVAEWESDVTNPRYGQPKYYNINFAPLETSGTSAEPTPSITKVHWSRVLHVADNRETSEIFGTPRQKPVYNRLCDLRKVAGGSAEMFWRGALPGYSFEIDPDTASDVELDSDALRKEFESFSSGLQRYMALMGVQAKSLAPQVADPESQVRVQIQLICICIGCPMRVFMGTEEGKLAGGQDSKAWNDRIDERRSEYIEPFLIRPLLDRLILFGVLPQPAEYFIDWPDLHTPTDIEKMEVAKSKVEVLARYIQSGADSLVPPMEFMTLVLGWTEEEAAAVLEAARDRLRQEEAELAGEFDDEFDDDEQGDSNQDDGPDDLDDKTDQ